jgi:histidinol phosphatase-like PHP family hydrolase
LALDNAQIAELLAREAEQATGTLQRAFRRAARRAFLWPEEATALLHQGRSLTEFSGIGPYLEKIIRRWMEDLPEVPAPPEIRANFLTLAKARAILAANPASRSRLRGDLQMHTRWSDGSGTIRDMAQSALEHGYQYIAITDHAKSLKIAGGIDEEQLVIQGKEIAAVSREFRVAPKSVRVLRSIELKLNPKGEGDLNIATLAKLDLVLGSFHSALRKTDDQTERYLAALRNPAVHVLGHPRGRIYNFRLGLRADWPRVFAFAAELDKAVEIDTYPDRQDLDNSLLAVARNAGVKISLGTDAHHPWQLSFMDLGLASALLAKIPPNRILNFMACDELREWAHQAREV